MCPVGVLFIGTIIKVFQKVFDSLPQQHPPPEKYIECRVATIKPFA